jgi:hypothetical protein
MSQLLVIEEKIMNEPKPTVRAEAVIQIGQSLTRYHQIDNE